MKYELLGTLRVVDDDRRSSISAPKIEVLLATLLVRADHVVTTDQLMGEIWGERLPRRATAGLHVYVSELRKFLHRPGRADGPIETRSPGYVLRRGSDSLDYQAFLELTDLGRARMREGRHAEAAELFDAGLALWHGPVLGDIGTGPILRSFVTRLSEVRMECTEMLVDCRLQLGHHRELIGTLFTLTTENPLREAFYRQLMLALCRSERRADALKVYQWARTTLIDELGLEPCAQLQDLHRAVLQADERVLELCVA
ncbi:AfsR/SARP family transcriptional regulator [Actinomadura rubrisoli]|uniref:Activator protein n=1 Tax=Actinomadura rubrisoli TaxID=2530368 RepID=A0A4R5C7X5_9ACTN|nr:AfsR/SARP family transcriptional regulator [Actinomadura rubrisoli]TDD94233.1 activator protein [Actinomadura rubrisoli]